MERVGSKLFFRFQANASGTNYLPWNWIIMNSCQPFSAKKKEDDNNKLTSQKLMFLNVSNFKKNMNNTKTNVPLYGFGGIAWWGINIYKVGGNTKLCCVDLEKLSWYLHSKVDRQTHVTANSIYKASNNCFKRRLLGDFFFRSQA